MRGPVRGLARAVCLLGPCVVLLACAQEGVVRPHMEVCAATGIDLPTLETFPDLAVAPDLVIETSPAPGCQPFQWDADHTACINATAALAGRRGADAVGFTRGRTYRYTGHLFFPDGLAASAVGDGSRPLPILQGDEGARGIRPGHGGEIRNLDLRGPRHGQLTFPVRLHEDWAMKGISAAGVSGWSVLGTRVSGYAGTGLLAVASNDIRVLGSSFSGNGYSGVSLFPHAGDCGRRVLIRGNVMEGNGQDGIDACSSELVIEDNVLRNNGWHGNPGDMNGILVWTMAVPESRDIVIRANRTYGNLENGIRVAGYDIDQIRIEGNFARDNRHWGLHVGGNGGPVRGLQFFGNVLSGNRWGCVSHHSHEAGIPIRSCCPTRAGP